MQIEQIQQKLGKCLIQGHEKHTRSLICTSNSCQAETKLICIKCICEQHNEHSDKCIFIVDIFSEKDKNVPNWTKQIIQQKIDALQTQLNEYQEFPLPVSIMREDFIQEVENQRCNLKQINTVYKKEISIQQQDLRQIFNSIFDLTQIKEIILKYSKKQIDKNQLQIQINDILTEPNRLAQKNNLKKLFKKCIKNIPQVQIHQKDKINGKIISTLSKLSGIVSNNKWIFEACESSQHNNLESHIISEDGNLAWQKGNNYQFYVKSSTSLQRNMDHCFKIRIIPNKDSQKQNGQIYMGFAQGSKAGSMTHILQRQYFIYLDFLNQNNASGFTKSPKSSTTNKLFQQYINEEKQHLTMEFIFQNSEKKVQVKCDEDESFLYTFDSQTNIKQNQQFGGGTVQHYEPFRRNSEPHFFIYGSSIDYKFQLIF